MTKLGLVVTGEEGEDIELGLKGVKLYIKRGGKDFTNGMLGHIKLLVDKEKRHKRLGAQARLNIRTIFLTGTQFSGANHSGKCL